VPEDQTAKLAECDARGSAMLQRIDRYRASFEVYRSAPAPKRSRS